MSKTIDPLVILKDHLQNNKKIEKQGNYLLFSDEAKLKLDTPTACVPVASGRRYNIGSLWLFLKHRGTSVASYIRQCMELKVEQVSAMDKGKGL
jgi:hypothetical protein